MVKSLSGPILVGAALLGLGGIAAVVAVAGSTDEQVGASNADVQVAAAPEAADPQAPQPVTEPAPSPHDPFVIKRILPINGPIKYGDWHWDEAGVPDGDIVVTVDLDARVLSIFRDGHEIGAAAVLLGTQEKPTPTGVFPITQKRRHHVSSIYGAEMPYMQRLTNDGISLHGSEVELGYASHGCIGMPEPFAAKVFGKTKVGDRVFITRGKMLDMGDSLVDS